MNKYIKYTIVFIVFLALGLASGWLIHGPAFPPYGLGDEYVHFFAGISFGIAMSLAYLVFCLVNFKKPSVLAILKWAVFSFIANFIATSIATHAASTGSWGLSWYDYFDVLENLIVAGAVGALIVSAGFSNLTKLNSRSVIVVTVLGGFLVFVASIIHHHLNWHPYFFNLWVVWQGGIAAALGVWICLPENNKI